ncbi:hypothetical protein H5410_022091 [Solanum commersonii]|uniref:Uncharacterized protein n=1 Tax=Solanum commersonii TaxID=4109 RepID=A0A9J5ZDT2_SOLCO|nr:hypothetical protein H5410_022091 [Solanum commersonii]
MTMLFPALVDITRTKGPNTEFGPTLTTAEHHRRDELIMARIIGPTFCELVDDGISTDEERLRTSSDIESDSYEEVYPAQASDEAEGGNAMED